MHSLKFYFPFWGAEVFTMLRLFTFVWVCTVFLFAKVVSVQPNVEDHAMQKVFPEKSNPTLESSPTEESFFDPPECPVSELPFDLNNIDTDFLLFTTSNPKNPITFKFDDESLPPFDKELDTKVIVHGFNFTLQQNSSFHEMKDALLKEGSYNVVVVNWTSSDRPPYLQAVGNARVVAAQLARVINTLKNTRGLQPSLVHLIGHSLGGQLVGLAGKQIKGLGRISGLDPAGPCFRKDDPLLRLHSGDATFVDVIVTNGASNISQGLGLYESIGDITFYPNGGRQQPGCEAPEGMLPKDSDAYQNSCSHRRAVDLFISSIYDKCRFCALSCYDYQDFTSGNCNRRFLEKKSQNSRPIKARMGFYSKKSKLQQPGERFYLSTSASPPFCTKK